MLAHGDLLVAPVGAQELGRLGGGRVLRIGILRVLVQVARAVWNGVDGAVHFRVTHLEAGVGHVDHRAPAELALDADRVVVALRRRRVALDAEYGARPVGERTLRADRQQRIHRPVDDARRVLRRGVSRHRVEAVRVDVGVVVQADARVEAGLRVAGQVVGQAEARLGLDALTVAEALRIVGVQAAHHAVVTIPGARHEGTDVDVGEDLSRHRIERDVDVVDARRLVEPGCLGGIVAFGDEDRGRLLRVPGRVPQEAQAVVERQPPVGLPRVLQVELRDVALADDLGERVDFPVFAERAEEGVGVSCSWCRTGCSCRCVKVNSTGPWAGADTTAALRVLRELEVVAGLDRVVALDPCQVRAQGRQPRLALDRRAGCRT